ncbi:alpha/beta fold hydrolase [Legionella longbeachae]|uniref:alpha/beta fold hydrolase n=1 Tax=Legionella longbeachae TaxID=450 RepID=UPI001246F9B3|nr:alpha/beta hydrolase [Legionella longbeachae]QEY51782.1 alpha/beta hydrolase [Legionella longbeachae]
MKLFLSNKAHFISNAFFSSSTYKALNNSFIFIPGLGCDERIWGKVNAGLNRLEQGNILYPPYHGKTIPEFASSILQQCEVASYKKLYIAGHSLGSNIAIKLAKYLLDSSIQVNGLVLVNGSIAPHTEREVDKKKRLVQKIHKEENFYKIIANPNFYTQLSDRLNNEDRELLMQMVKKTGKDVFVHQLLATLNRHATKEDLLELLNNNINVIAINGDKDKVIPNSGWSDLLNTYKNFTSKIVANGSHILPMEHNEIILDSIKSLFCSSKKEYLLECNKKDDVLKPMI